MSKLRVEEGTSCSKEEHERRYKSWHYTVSTICYSDYWLVFVRSIVLYAGGTSRPDDYDFTREDGEKLAEIVTADDPSVMITRESLTPLFSYIKENPSYVNELKGYLRQGENNGTG